MLRVGVDTGASGTEGEGIPEQRGTGGFFQTLRGQLLRGTEFGRVVAHSSGRYAQKIPLRPWLWDRGLREGQDKDVFRLDAFLLHTRRREVDVLAMPDGYTSSSSSHPA